MRLSHPHNRNLSLEQMEMARCLRRGFLTLSSFWLLESRCADKIKSGLAVSLMNFIVNSELNEIKISKIGLNMQTITDQRWHFKRRHSKVVYADVDLYCTSTCSFEIFVKDKGKACSTIILFAVPSETDTRTDLNSHKTCHIIILLIWFEWLNQSIKFGNIFIQFHGL